MIYLFVMKRKFQIFLFFILIYIVIIFYFDFNKTKFTLSPEIESISKKPLTNLEKLNLKYQLEFEQVLNKSCDPMNFTINYHCISEIHKIDLKFSKLKSIIINNYTNSSECQTNNSKNNNDDETKLNFHTFWQLNEPISNDSLGFRMLNLNVMSFLTTQNLECSKLILWVLEHFPAQLKQQIKEKFAYYLNTNVLEIRNFKIDELCKVAIRKQTNFAKSKICSNSKTDELRNRHLISLSDFVRFLVLDIYGGIYTDGDVIYLKDMSILSTYNFAYRWSFTNDYNTAVMGINGRLNKEKTRDLYDLFIRASSIDQFIHQLHPIRLSNLVLTKRNVTIFKYNSFVALHSGLFDPAWLCNDQVIPRASGKDVCGFKDFTSSKLINETEFKADMFFTGAFTYHFHLSGSASEINNQSYFKYFENYFNREFLN